MKKTLIICIVIIVVLVIGDILLQRKINNTFDYMISKLYEIDEENNYSLKKDKIEELDKYWDNNCTLISCFVEHVELEKVKGQIIVIESAIEVEDKPFVHEEIKRTIYSMELIKEKKLLRIDNIM